VTEMQESLLAKEDGMALALSRHGIDGWKAAFIHVVESMPVGTLFTSEDIIDQIGLPSGGVRMHGNNAVGAMMSAVAKRGLAVKSGRHTRSRRRVSHATEVPVWVRGHAAPEQVDLADAKAAAYLDGYDAGVIRGRDIERDAMRAGEVWEDARREGRQQVAAAAAAHAAALSAAITRGRPARAHHQQCYREHPECAAKAVAAAISRAAQ